MNLFLLVSLLFSFAASREPEIGYWVCDVIREETNTDIVILPGTILTDSLLFNTPDSLIITSVTVKELNQLISENYSVTGLMPISGFSVICDSIGRTSIVLDKLKEKPYTLFSTKSLHGLTEMIKSKKTTLINQTISDIIISYLGKGKNIALPRMNRYQLCVNRESDKVNINTASLEELMSLPGIGPKIGQKIIDYRCNNGLFHSKEEIKNVNGIGQKKFEQIKTLITF